MQFPTSLSAPRVSGDGWPTAAALVAGVIGDPVRQSLSPVLHNAAYRAMGLDWAYLAFPVRTGAAADAVTAMRTLGIVGLSVTMPHKDGVAAAADERAPAVELLGAANTLRWTGGANPWEGTAIGAESTDGPGLMDALHAAGASVKGSRCAVLGTGGASRAVIHALAEAGAAEVVVVSRSQERAAEVARTLAPGIGRAAAENDVARDVARAEMIINGTPVGMSGKADGLPIDPAHLSSGQIVVDLVYSPPETPLLVAAREQGARIMNGLPMLVFQAARQIEFWSGMEAPPDVMLAAVGLTRNTLTG